MGRRKIQIAPITDDRNRNVTFGKRRNGLFKKAYELGVLCSVDVAVLVWGHNGKLFAFSSQGSLKGVVDRYHSQSQDECDVIGPAHYGGEINPSTLLSGGGGGSEMNGISGSGSRNKSGGGVKKRRRSDDDSDDDDDDDDDGDDGGMLDAPTLSSMSNSNQHGLSTSAPGSSLPHDIGGLFPNGSPSSNANMHRYNQSQQHQQQQHQNQLHQQAQHLQNLQQAQQHPHSALSSHPFFGNYPYPGYPHHMPNVNPALGNPLGFYAPSAAAMAAAAAATGQYGAYGGAAALPPHLLRAATVAQQYAQQETGSSGSTPSSAGNVQNNSNGNGNSAGYAPIVRSPPPMDMSQQQQQQGEGSSNGYGSQSQQQLSPRSGGGRKPSLHLSFSSNNNHQSSGRPSGSQGPSRNSSMNENDNSQQHQSQQYNQLSQQEQQQRQQQQQQQQHAALLEEAAVVSAYAEQAGLTVPGVGNGPGGSGGMQFPDSFLTSPSQLFPEIYRSMNSYAESQAHRAMTFGAENTPTADEDEGDNARNVFRWPTLGGSGGGGGGVSNGGTSSQTGGNGGSNINGSNTPRSQAHSNSTTDTTSHLRINGQTEVKREADGNESDAIAELAMS